MRNPLPWPVRLLNGAATPVAARWLHLDADDLLRRARAQTGLDDFGGESFQTPLRILTDALERDGGLHAFGRFAHRTQLLGLLVTRLRLEDLLRRRPEILAEPIEKPIVILGLPRTGTTILQRMLARDPGLRSLPYWEALSPLPEGDAAVAADPAPRLRRAEQSVRLVEWCIPQMKSMHELDAADADEEIWLLAVDFASMLHETTALVPAYRDWFESADLTPSYAYLRRLLQVLQWYRRGERWLLKSPQHLGQLRPLLSVFPDATVVQTHRDPVKVTASVCSMISYSAHMNVARPDPRAIARYWADRLQTLLRKSAEDRPLGQESRFVDVHFRELLADPIAVARRIYAAAERDLTPAAENAMRAYLAANPRGKHGAHTYRLEDFGLDPEERRAALRAYRERFGVEDE